MSKKIQKQSTWCQAPHATRPGAFRNSVVPRLAQGLCGCAGRRAKLNKTAVTSIAPSQTTRKSAGTTCRRPRALNAMADNFNNFYGDLEEEATVRKQAEDARVARIERSAGRSRE